MGGPKGLGQTLHAKKLVWPRMVKFTAVPSKKVPWGLARVELHRGVRGKLPSTLTQPSRVPNFSPHGLSPCGLPPSALESSPFTFAPPLTGRMAPPRVAIPSFSPTVATPTWHGAPTASTRRRAATQMHPGTTLVKNASTERGLSHPYPRTGHLGPTSSACWHGAPFASYKSKWNAGRPERRPVKYMAHTNHPKMFQPATLSQPRKLSQHEQKHRPT